MVHNVEEKPLDIFSKMFKNLGDCHPKFLKILGVLIYFEKKSLEMGTFFGKNGPEKGNFKARSAHPRPNQI